MSGYNGRNIDEVFPFALRVPDKDLAEILVNALFKAEVSFAVIQDLPYTIRLTESGQAVVQKVLTL